MDIACSTWSSHIHLIGIQHLLHTPLEHGRGNSPHLLFHPFCTHAIGAGNGEFDFMTHFLASRFRIYALIFLKDLSMAVYERCVAGRHSDVMG